MYTCSDSDKFDLTEKLNIEQNSITKAKHCE